MNATTTLFAFSGSLGGVVTDSSPQSSPRISGPYFCTGIFSLPSLVDLNIHPATPPATAIPTQVLEGAPPSAKCAKGRLLRSKATQSLPLVSPVLRFLDLSSRPERPDFFFRADLWRVGPRRGGIPPPSFPISSAFPLRTLRLCVILGSSSVSCPLTSNF